MRRVMVVLDTDPGYAARLAAYFNQHGTGCYRRRFDLASDAAKV